MNSGGSFVPFALPEIGQEEIDEVVDTLRSGWITTGPKTRLFEQRFGEFLGGGVECVSVNSATAGLHLALEAVGVGPGDEVIVPTHTFTATAEVVRYLGAEPRIVDVDPVTSNLDIEAVVAATTSKTRAILPVHYAGLPVDMAPLLAHARQRGVAVVEDAAHAFPARYRGRLIGTLDSDCTVFSFYANKTLATGEGGMLVTRSPELARRARVMRLHGIDRDAFDRYSAKRPSWYYEVVAPGFKYNLTDIASSLGLHQLAKSERFLARRQALAERYHGELADLPIVLPARPAADGVHAWHLYVVRLREDAGITRDQAVDRLYEAEVACSVHYIPLHRQPYWRERYGLRPEDFPSSEQLYRNSFSIPLYTRLTDDQQSRVVGAVRSLFRR